jgi:glycosyltransferase involved in cell wall biosynthesis
MKVLLVTGEFPPMQGGVGDYTREVALALADQGCPVQVLTSVHGGPVEGLDVLPWVGRWDWGCWRLLGRAIARYRPDVVHIQYQAAAYGLHPAINLFPRRLRLAAGRPGTVVTFHDLRVPYLFPKAGPLRRWVVTELARASDAAITTNREDFEDLGRRLSSPPALIPIGSNIQPRLPEGYDRDAWRARYGLAPGDLLLCFFGFINDRKGVDTLLQALKLLAEEGGVANPRLLMIGGQTGASDPTNVAYLARIEQLITRLGLQGRVVWTGYIGAEEVSAGFVSADLCVLPFRDGVSFLHGTFHAALVHGMPIVTTYPRLPLPELSHGENIYFVPPQDAPALAEAIRRLAGAPDLRRALGEGARALSADFRWDRIGAATLQLCRHLAAERGRDG